MTESIGPMWLPKPLQPGGGCRLPLVGPEPQSKGRDGRNCAPCSSSAMSSGRLFLDRVALQQSPSPLPRQPQDAPNAGLATTENQRVVNCPKIPCLTRGVHSTFLSTKYLGNLPRFPNPPAESGNPRAQLAGSRGYTAGPGVTQPNGGQLSPASFPDRCPRCRLVETRTKHEKPRAAFSLPDRGNTGNR
jgi:hypothetical protein